MAIKKFRPTSPGKRFQTVSTFEEITTRQAGEEPPAAPEKVWREKLLRKESRLGIEEGAIKRCIG